MALSIQATQQSVLQKQAIEEARSLYSRLPHDDRVLRQSPEGKETLAEVLKAVEQKCQDHKRKKSTKNLANLHKNTIWLQNISGVVDVAVQSQAGIGCPLWAPIKLVLKVSNDDSKATEHVSDLLESLFECLPRFEIYEKLQADNRLQVALLHVFTDVIDFSVRAYQFFRRNAFVRLTKTLVRSFDHDIGTVIARLERHARAAHETAVALELLAAAEFRRETEQRLEEEKKTQCEDWLNPANVRSTHLLHVKAQLRGTCDWITQIDEYTKWANSNYSTIKDRLLLVSGRPGCGKSIVSSNPNPIYCVIDALDECRDFDQDAATEIMSALKTCSNLRVIVLTRPQLVETYSQSLEFQEIAITPALLDQDIDAFLRDQVFESDLLQPPELRERIYEDLKDKADGMFLYIRLMIDDIKKSSSKFETIERLQNLPCGLENSYRLVFLRLSQRLGRFELRLAQSMLAFISAACRPLLFEEFRHAYALQNKVLVSDQRPLEEFLLIQRPQTILTYLDGLVCMTDGVLHFTHSSVREFLIRPEEQWIRESNHAMLDFRIDLTDAHRSLSWLCIDYMKLKRSMLFVSTSDTFQSLSTVQDSYPFFEYATLHTFHHLNRSGPPCATTIAKIEDILESSQGVLWVKNFARLQFEDLTLLEDVAEFLDFTESVVGAGLDLKFAAIFEQTLQKMSTRRGNPVASDDTCLEQISMYLKYVREGQVATPDTIPDNAASIPQSEPVLAATGSEFGPRLHRNESDLNLKDTSALVSRISDILKGHSSIPVAHQIEVYVRLQVSLGKIRAWVDPLKLLYRLIVRKASAVPVYALVAVGDLYRRLRKFNEALEIYTAASKKVHNLEVPLKYTIYEDIGFCHRKLFRGIEALEAREMAYRGWSLLFGERHKRTLESLLRIIQESWSSRSNEELLRLCDMLSHGQDLVSELNIGSNIGFQRQRIWCYLNAGDDERASHMKRCLRATLEQYRDSQIANCPEEPAVSHNIVGLAYEVLGDYEAALKSYKLRYEGRKRSAGAEDADTMVAQANLANIYLVLQMHDQAEALYRDLYEKYVRLLGSHHPLSQQIANNLNVCEHEGQVASEDKGMTEFRLRPEDELEVRGDSVGLPPQPIAVSNPLGRGPPSLDSYSQFHRSKE